MTGGVRLRQICLVAPCLEPVVGDIAAIMGLAVCYRDPNVAHYGLENALLPVDTVLLEVVAPLRDGTAAGRFIEKSGGRGGYMGFSCDDPRGGRRTRNHWVRVAHVIDRPLLGSSFIRATAAPPHRVQSTAGSDTSRSLSPRVRLGQGDLPRRDHGADRGGAGEPPAGRAAAHWGASSARRRRARIPLPTLRP